MADLSPRKSAPRRFAFSRAELGELWRTVLTVIFYRAWIGTLGIIVVLIAFTGTFPKLAIVSDQTHEILRGIRDTLFLVDQRKGIQACIAIWLAALALAFVLAIVTRVTGVLAFGPSSDEKADDRTRSVVEFYACTVLVATLVIIHVTFVFHLIGSMPILLVLFGVTTVAFLLVTVGPWIALRRRKARRLAYVLIYAAITAVILGSQWIPPLAVRDAGTAMKMVGSVTPAASAVVLWMVLMVAPGIRLWFWLLATSTALLTFVLFYPWRPDLVLATGSISVVLIFLAWLACVLALGQFLLRRVSRFVPAVPVLIAVVVVVVIADPPERLGREKLGPFDRIAVTKTAPQAIAASDETGAGDKPAIANRLAIHADGGGLRAALFTAATLAFADDITCGEFGAHVFAASGVSGGSVGIATWAAMRQEFIQREGGAWRGCAEFREWYLNSKGKFGDGDRTFNFPLPLTALVVGTLAGDHLSNALAGMLTRDLFGRSGEATRGQALLDSWQNAALRALAFGQPGPPALRMFGIPLAEANAGFPDAPPLLIFSATDADTGGRVIFSNAKWRPSYESMSIGAAALNSARFPVISPAGAVFDGEKWIRVVDGGYFDNSGADTLSEMLRGAQKHHMLIGTVAVVRIDGNALDREDQRCDPFIDAMRDAGYPGWLPVTQTAPKPKQPPPTADDPPPTFSGWSGSSAFLAARSARADEAVEELKPGQNPLVSNVLGHERLDYYSGFETGCANRVAKRKPTDPWPACIVRNLQACLAGRMTPRAPLGWYLSPVSARAILISASRSAAHIARQLDLSDFVRGTQPAQ